MCIASKDGCMSEFVSNVEINVQIDVKPWKLGKSYSMSLEITQKYKTHISLTHLSTTSSNAFFHQMNKIV